MRCRWSNFAPLLPAALVLLSLPLAMAQSCVTESQMAPQQRGLYGQAARSLGAQILSGNATAVQADTIASVAAQFAPVAATIEQVTPLVQKGTLTVDALYNLDARDLKSNDGKAGAGQAQFFCSVANSALLVTVTIPNLPAGNYLLAILHATGVPQPQQITLLMQNDPPGSPSWKLAGLYVRPMTLAGHDGLWFWTKARGFAAKQQNWNAWLYYRTAALLLNPVDFLSSPNLEKLLKEQQEVAPSGLPGAQPMVVTAATQSLEVTDLHPADFSGSLDLMVDYKAFGGTDPVATRAQIVSLMQALLTAHPDLRDGFHGLWVYAHYANGQSFAIELPMNQIAQGGR